MKTKFSVFVLLAIEFICLVSYFLHQTSDISELENRSLMTFDMVVNNPPSEDSIIYKATVSERFEDAMRDQFFGRDWISLYYTDYNAFLENIYSFCKKVGRSTLSKFVDLDINNNDKIITDYTRWPVYGSPRLSSFPKHKYLLTKIGSLYRFNDTDYIFDGPKVNPPNGEQVEAHAAQIEHIHELYPNIKLYSYYVSSLNSTKWFDAEWDFDTPDYFELIAQAMPDYMKVKRLTYQDDVEYESMFYKSDHHWSYKGFTQGYEDIYNMIAEDYSLSPLKCPVKVWNYSELYDVEYRGSRASKLQGLYEGYDEFIVPEYDLGDRTCFSINTETGYETPVTLSLWDTYKTGKMSKDRYYDHYIHFYYSAFDKDGNDLSNEYYLITNNLSDTGHNLLLVTDSTGRAIRDVLGSHFDSEVYLDYRNMSAVKVDEIIEKYNIDTIVMNGLGAVWTENEYRFHFTDRFGEEE